MLGPVHGNGARWNWSYFTAKLQLGEIVTLEIPLPLTPYPLKIRAIVRYCDGLSYGFEFLTLTEAQRETVHRVCEILDAKA